MQPKPTADRATPHAPAPALVDPWDAMDDHLTDHDGLCGSGCRDLVALWGHVIQHMRAGL